MIKRLFSLMLVVVFFTTGKAEEPVLFSPGTVFIYTYTNTQTGEYIKTVALSIVDGDRESLTFDWISSQTDEQYGVLLLTKESLDSASVLLTSLSGPATDELYQEIAFFISRSTFQKLNGAGKKAILHIENTETLLERTEDKIALFPLSISASYSPAERMSLAFSESENAFPDGMKIIETASDESDTHMWVLYNKQFPLIVYLETPEYTMRLSVVF